MLFIIILIIHIVKYTIKSIYCYIRQLKIYIIRLIINIINNITWTEVILKTMRERGMQEGDWEDREEWRMAINS